MGGERKDKIRECGKGERKRKNGVLNGMVWKRGNMWDDEMGSVVRKRIVWKDISVEYRGKGLNGSIEKGERKGLNIVIG